ncbi:hypothetical protein BWQ96_03388 [Gracilariopsis chorda]|uniref:Uncharacterized protein n=1 Tax=Gracilariopsis chorda TaxID=448386 RepID=A0A2V3IXN0_9FLOR|nr:hypothetical protein BWQ96_03388 [Gracilariopsis chorda]|eukprot:PXF46859.1 hypothetical protein BWQ96_03388 [Gracilariopsis chorda]
MSPSTIRTTALPSKFIERAIVLLLGLSFGEHDDGTQRRVISQKLADVINKWVSGLLAADFASDEVEATFLAFSKLLHSEGVPELIMWSEVPISDIDSLIHLHWVRASRNLIELPLPPAKPIELAIDSLSTGLKLLDFAAAKDNRRSAAANTAPAHLIFATTRLLLSRERLPNRETERIGFVCEESLEHLLRMRRFERKADLLSSLFQSVIPLIRLAVEVDLNTLKPAYNIHCIAPTSHVLHRLMCDATDQNLNDNAGEVLAILRDLAEAVQEHIRVQALYSMSFLSSRIPLFSMQPSKTCESLLSAIVWNDAPTLMTAIPLLAALLPRTRISDSQARRYSAAVSKIVETIVRLMQTRENGTSNAEHALVLTNAKAAVELAGLVPPLLKELMMRHMGWLTALSDFAKRIANMARHGDIQVSDIVHVLTVLSDSVKWAWLRVDSFRSDVFEACLSVFMETKDVEDSFLIRTEIKRIVLQLGKCGRVDQILEIVQEVRQSSNGYDSLRSVAEFCKEIENDISFENENDDQATIAGGALFSRFFSELV